MYICYKCGEKIFNTSTTDENIKILTTENNGNVVIKIEALNDIELIKSNIFYVHKFDKKDLFFLNGYQSWTDTKEFEYNEKIKNVRKIPKFLNDMFKFTQYGDSFIYEEKKNVFHAFDIAYVKGNNELAIVNNNYKNAYLIIEFDKKNDRVILNSDVRGLVLKKNKSFILYDFNMSNNINELLSSYFSKFNKKSDKKIFGYTSWYNHYQNINENIILEALNKVDSRIELFQIDDGYEEYVGDWLNIDKNKFPNGLKLIVDKIHNKNLKAGIWLAPFVCETKSSLYKNHFDWIKKDEFGNPISCGGNWSGFYALDLNNNDVINYINEVLNYYKELGFDFFKLDFLYASNLSRIDGFTNAMTCENAYNILANNLKDKIILGCGAILSSSYEKFDFLRIGPDVSLIFDDVWYMKFMHRERISTKVTLQNTIYRSIMNNQVFLNDPDVFLLRDDNIKLNKKQRYALTIINALFGSLLMTSDNALDYDDSKNLILDEALHLFNNAKVLSYSRNKNIIRIKYELDSKTYEIKYDTNKGIII